MQNGLRAIQTITFKKRPANPLAGSRSCSVVNGLTASERLLFQTVIDATVEEAAERQIELTVADVTLRLLCAFERGIRDEEELKDAVMFNDLRVYLH